MPDQSSQARDPDRPAIYQIRLKGHLGRAWTDRVADLTVTLEDSGDTLLTGPVVDQAALFGLLRKVRDSGVPLLSVNRIEPGPSALRGMSQADAAEVKS